MPFEVGDVFLVPFPFTDQSATKKRPAVVVSGRDYNAARPDVILMAITSQFRPSADFGDLWLRDWRTAGLRANRYSGSFNGIIKRFQLISSWSGLSRPSMRTDLDDRRTTPEIGAYGFPAQGRE